MEEEQREAMYNGWRRKQDEIESECGHKWSFSQPIHCLNCGMDNTKYVKNTEQYLKENPSGKIDDLPKDIKDQFENIFNTIRDIEKDKKK